ncbi:hypothetical protein LCGC14_1244170 [marine sediment metagenome]|uniref:TNase-like domain-containing protein n=1 Tax=marine sediment metagenome TaxID=412755 RepID=A0A0F9NM90_9ZZZZ
MAQGHDFKAFPELSNSQLQFYYFESPHKQMVEPFDAKVIRVIDGDTIKVRVPDRDFDFPIRFARTAAPELDEQGGPKSQKFLESELLNQDVHIELATSRVGKFGRLLGEVTHFGRNMNDLTLDLGYAIKFEDIQNGFS